jgi:hypothetical protein
MTTAHTGPLAVSATARSPRRWLLGAAAATLGGGLPYPLFVVLGTILFGYQVDLAESLRFPAITFVIALGLAGPVAYLIGLPCAVAAEHLGGHRPVLTACALLVLGATLGAAAGSVLDAPWPLLAVHGAAAATAGWGASRRRTVGRIGQALALLVPIASLLSLTVSITSGLRLW